MFRNSVAIFASALEGTDENKFTYYFDKSTGMISIAFNGAVSQESGKAAE